MADDPLSLSIQHGGQQTYLQGEPIKVEVTLGNKAAYCQWQENQRSDGLKGEIPGFRIANDEFRWIDRLEFRLYQLQDHDEPHPILPDWAWDQHIPPGSLHYGAEQKVVDLKVASIIWFLPPEVTSQLPIGRYRVEGMFDTLNAPGKGVYHVRLGPARTDFELRVVQSPDDELTLLLSQARYHQVNTRKYDEAIPLAKQALKIDPQNYQAHFIIAESCHWGKRWGEALAAYEDCLRLLESTKDQEAQGLIRFRINLVKQKLPP
jgi:tetratricopeptide (TPR) repeat protein